MPVLINLKKKSRSASKISLPKVKMLSVLSLELHFQIFSYVFSTEDEGLIMLRATQRGDWASDMGLPPYATLLQDPRYDDYRSRRRVRDVWPDPVEEAFHKGVMTPCPRLSRADQLPASFTMDYSLST